MRLRPLAVDTPVILSQTSECIKDWKFTVPRQRLFLKIIFITDWGQKVHPKTGLCLWTHGFPSFLLGFITCFPWALVAEVRLSVWVFALALWRPVLNFPFILCLNLRSLRNELIVHKWASVDYTEQWLL